MPNCSPQIFFSNEYTKKSSVCLCVTMCMWHGADDRVSNRKEAGAVERETGQSGAVDHSPPTAPDWHWWVVSVYSTDLIVHLLNCMLNCIVHTENSGTTFEYYHKFCILHFTDNMRQSQVHNSRCVLIMCTWLMYWTIIFLSPVVMELEQQLGRLPNLRSVVVLSTVCGHICVLSTSKKSFLQLCACREELVLMS